MKVRLISITPEAEKLMAYCARVSSKDQANEKIEGLLTYCMKHGHWSVFEMADMTVEIETSRALSPQILRHKSFSFQEFSQRYAEANDFELYTARRQDKKNRQNSIDDLSDETKSWFYVAQAKAYNTCNDLYKQALEKGIAKEQARFLLPSSTLTKLYMKGSIRSWIHYLQVRCAPETQKEHRDIANEIASILNEQLPIIGGILNVTVSKQVQEGEFTIEREQVTSRSLTESGNQV